MVKHFPFSFKTKIQKMSIIACLPVLTYHYKLQINLPKGYKKGYLLSYTRDIRQFLSLTFGKEHNKFENLQTQNFYELQG